MMTLLWWDYKLTWVNQMQNMSHSQIVSDFAFSQIFPTFLKIHQFSKIEFEILLAVHQQSWHYDSLYDHPQRHHFDSRLIYKLRFCMCLNKLCHRQVINTKKSFILDSEISKDLMPHSLYSIGYIDNAIFQPSKLKQVQAFIIRLTLTSFILEG